MKLLDATLWIDYSRARSPDVLKQLIEPFIFDPEACLAEPVTFEVLRYANEQEARWLERQFHLLPMLQTPATLWSDALTLGRRCRQEGVTAGSLDLLIAAVALHHDAEVVTFDVDFERIASLTTLRVTRLSRVA